MLNAFLRISTNKRVFERPLSLNAAVGRVQSWFDQPCTRLVQPTEHHWVIFQKLLSACGHAQAGMIQGQAIGGLVTDAHLAALAIEHGYTLFTTDADFSRFQNLVVPLLSVVLLEIGENGREPEKTDWETLLICPIPTLYRVNSD